MENARQFDIEKDNLPGPPHLYILDTYAIYFCVFTMTITAVTGIYQGCITCDYQIVYSTQWHDSQ